MSKVADNQKETELSKLLELKTLEKKMVQERVERAKEKIQKVLQEEACTLDVKVILHQGKIDPIIDIIPQ